jgi:3-(methylthio)propanoyl-CoA dehydrogenase
MYTPPVREMRFQLCSVLGVDAPEDLVEQILDEAAKLAVSAFLPLNRVGDKSGVVCTDTGVTMPPGFRDAYQAYVSGGWNGVAADEKWGGMGLPFSVAMAVQEMWQSANMSLALCPLLNQGAIEAISAHGTDAQKALYLPPLVEGRWTGTMNLTESGAGSDVGAIRTRAVPDGDHYRLFGQKIFISYGDHDLADNILHLVLARMEGAEAGTRGLSLFLVPKYLVNSDGTLGARNDVVAASTEHKLGQHASPTCVMSFGDKDGAIGYLLGAVGGGMAAMFTMMNHARLGVGIQGIAVAEAACQQALAYADVRLQPKPISDYPDVQRMLKTMQSSLLAARALAYDAGHALDRFKASGDKADAARADLLTPIVKAWATDLANDLTSLALQVHGGMGYIEETGIAQYVRDARVLAIYEGTNGIQANDLAFRKILRDGGQAARTYIAELRTFAKAAPDLPLDDSLTALESALTWVLAASPDQVAASATPFLRLFALTAGAARLAHSLQISREKAPDMAPHIQKMAAFFAGNSLPMTTALQKIVEGGADSILK